MTAETDQLLHLVIGGELRHLDAPVFRDLSKVEFVGAFPNYQEAYDAWKAAAHRTVDHAETRYFILHAHRLLDPENLVLTEALGVGIDHRSDRGPMRRRVEHDHHHDQYLVHDHELNDYI